jgi:hypothetical protein
MDDQGASAVSKLSALVENSKAQRAASAGHKKIGNIDKQ